MDQPKLDYGLPQVCGDFIDDIDLSSGCLEMLFTPSLVTPSLGIDQQHWRNNRLSAHFISEYFINFLPLDPDNQTEARRIKEGKGAVSYIANELLENSTKFHEKSSSYRIKFGVKFAKYDHDITAILFASNAISLTRLVKLRLFIDKILSSDTHALYIEQIEKSVEQDTNASGLGLLTMINDYNAKVGWKIESIDELTHLPDHVSQQIIVTTMVQITV